MTRRAVGQALCSAPTTTIGDLFTQLGVDAHDDEAFSQLYEALQARVHRRVVAVVRDRTLAEDVTQDVMLELWRLADRFDPDRGNAMGWAMTIATRRGIDCVRKEVARRTHEQRSAWSRDVAANGTADLSDSIDLRDAMDGLPTHQRQPIELAFVGGHTHVEIAELMAAPLGTVKSSIRRGLLQMQEAMAL